MRDPTSWPGYRPERTGTSNGSVCLPVPITTQSPREPEMDKPFAITLDVGSSQANKTGSWRTERAVYTDRLPPCNNVCPAGENIQAWLFDAEGGGSGYESAWRRIMD